MIILDAIRAGLSPGGRHASGGSRAGNVTSLDSPGIVFGDPSGCPNAAAAQKLSAVFAAVELRSDTMSVLPDFCMDSISREHVDHPILRLLCGRPNEAMTPSVRKKLLERSILLSGNAYDWIIRDPISREPVELIPIAGELVTVWVDRNRRPWYDVTDPATGERFRLPSEDVCHYKGPSTKGFVGKSVLGYAAQTVQAGLAAQQYNRSFYESGGHPSGVLTLETDLGGYVKDKDGNDTDVTKKEYVANEWEKLHAGPNNAHRIAVLDHGMKYTPIGINQKDADFISQQNVTVEDIARYFGVPLYKLQSGKQSYNSNEQNAIEYVSRIQPRVTQMEEEQTYKLLSLSDLRRGLQLRKNMDALLRADSQSRAEYYRTMTEIGVYSVDDICELEDRPHVPGGDARKMSLNYVPLEDWAELSRQRNQGGT